MAPYKIMLLTALVTGFGSAVGKNLASILSHIASLVISGAGQPELVVDVEGASGTDRVSLFHSEGNVLEIHDPEMITELIAEELEPAAEKRRADAWGMIAKNFWERLIAPDPD